MKRLHDSLKRTERIHFDFAHVCQPGTAHENANRAIRMAYLGDELFPSYDWLVLMDDDIEFQCPRTIERLLGRAEEQRYAIASVPDWGPYWPDKPERPQTRDRVGVANFIPGYLQAFNLKLWWAKRARPRYLEGFPGAKGTSDTEVCFHAVQCGLRIGYWFGAYVTHYNYQEDADPNYAKQAAMVRKMYGDDFLRRQGQRKLIEDSA